MASIISYIGSVPCPDKDNPLPSGITCWDGAKTFVENIVKYNLDDQLRVYLDQTLAAAYYNTFYGKRCHDLVTEFIDELVVHFECGFLPKAEREFTVAPRAKILEAVKNLVYYIKEGAWKNDVPVALIKEYMDAKPYDAFPSAWRAGQGQDNYVPFLMWKNRAKQDDFNEKATDRLGLTTFSFSCRHVECQVNSDFKLCLNARTYPIGTSFSTSETPLDKQPVAIISYLSHFDLSQVSFERLVGAIGESCLHLDIRRSGLCSSQKLAMCIASNVMGIHSLSGSQVGVASDLDNYKRGLFSTMKTFLEFAHKQYGTEVKDREVLGRLFYCVSETKEQRSSASYIRVQGGSASADDLGSYRKTFGSLEALQFISQSPTLLSAQSQVAEAVVAATEENTDTKEQDAQPSDDKKGDDAKQSESDQPKDDPKEETNDEKSGEDDTKQDDTTEDDTSSDENDLGGDDADAGTGNDEPGSSGEETDASSDDMPEEDDSINTSDDNGVRFEVVNPEGETTDSVMFREEVNNFISNILANPPEDLSPQDTATLTALQRFWLYSLSIETIMGILGSCALQLPDSLTKLNTQCTE